MYNAGTMDIVKLELKGAMWAFDMADSTGKKHSYIMQRVGDETLASAAVRLEDAFRKLQTGEEKPLNLVV